MGPSWYSCDPTKCTGTCLCPSLTAPGNLAPQDIPQFIIVTHDDAITALANRGVRSVTDGHKNPNGCNVPATWFTTSSGTDCSLVKKLFNDNHEIALHTVHHKQLVPSLNGMEDEIMGAKTFLVKQCGLPADALVGFRSPYLIHNPTDRAILAKNGILYDSSIEEFVGPDSKTTTSFGNRLWPYTMDNGIVQNCNWTYPSGQCQESERYPGMWEIPMWDLLNSTTNTEQNGMSFCFNTRVPPTRTSYIRNFSVQHIPWTLPVALEAISSQPSRQILMKPTMATEHHFLSTSMHHGSPPQTLIPPTSSLSTPSPSPTCTLSLSSN